MGTRAGNSVVPTDAQHDAYFATRCTNCGSAESVRDCDDDETHAWLAAQAKEQCRSIGNQALFLLGLKRPAKQPSKRKGAKAK